MRHPQRALFAGREALSHLSLDEDHIRREKALFEKEIRPFLKVEPLRGSRPRQKQLYLLVKLTRSRHRAGPFCLVGLPTALPRLFDLSKVKEEQCLIRVEDVVKHYLHRLFPKDQVEHVAVFRIIRNQNFPVQERTGEDIVPAVREMLSRRLGGEVMRLEAEERMSEEMLTLLMQQFGLERERRYRVTGPLDLNRMLMNLYALVKRPGLKYPPAQPVEVAPLMGQDAFEQIDRRDWLLYHPYHSFAPVVHLMKLAAQDPTVRAIRQTLYRVSGNSPIVRRWPRPPKTARRCRCSSRRMRALTRKTTSTGRAARARGLPRDVRPAGPQDAQQDHPV